MFALSYHGISQLKSHTNLRQFKVMAGKATSMASTRKFPYSTFYLFLNAGKQTNRQADGHRKGAKQEKDRKATKN